MDGWLAIPNVILVFESLLVVVVVGKSFGKALPAKRRPRLITRDSPRFPISIFIWQTPRRNLSARPSVFPLHIPALPRYTAFAISLSVHSVSQSDSTTPHTPAVPL